MRKFIAGLVAAAALFVAQPAQATTWCPYGGGGPPGSQCWEAYSWNPPVQEPGMGYGSTTYLHVGDAMYWAANKSWAGTQASFLYWSRCQLVAGCATGNPYNIGAGGSATYTRYSNTYVSVGIHAIMPWNHTYCFWVVDVAGADASMSRGAITSSGCGPY